MSQDVAVLARRVAESYGSPNFPRLMAELKQFVGNDGKLVHLLSKHGLKKQMSEHASYLKQQGRKQDADNVRRHIGQLFGKQYH